MSKFPEIAPVVALGTASLFRHKSADNAFSSCAEYWSDELHTALGDYGPRPLCLLQSVGISSEAGIMLDLPPIVSVLSDRQIDVEQL